MQNETIEALEDLLAKAKSGDLYSISVVGLSSEGYHFLHEGNGFELFGMATQQLKRIESINSQVFGDSISK